MFIKEIEEKIKTTLPGMYI